MPLEYISLHPEYFLLLNLDVQPTKLPNQLVHVQILSCLKNHQYPSIPEILLSQIQCKNSQGHLSGARWDHRQFGSWKQARNTCPQNHDPAIILSFQLVLEKQQEELILCQLGRDRVPGS